MMTIEDAETIKNAIWKRLQDVGKTEIADIKVINQPDAVPPHIQVGVWCIFMDRMNHEGLLDARSHSDLQPEFSHKHLLNEIDQIAEQHKEARKATQASALLFQPGAIQSRAMTKGTGLRGLWRR